MSSIFPTALLEPGVETSEILHIHESFAQKEGRYCYRRKEVASHCKRNRVRRESNLAYTRTYVCLYLCSDICENGLEQRIPYVCANAATSEARSEMRVQDSGIVRGGGKRGTLAGNKEKETAQEMLCENRWKTGASPKIAISVVDINANVKS